MGHSVASRGLNTSVNFMAVCVYGEVGAGSRGWDGEVGGGTGSGGLEREYREGRGRGGEGGEGEREGLRGNINPDTTNNRWSSRGRRGKNTGPAEPRELS